MTSRQKQTVLDTDKKDTDAQGVGAAGKDALALKGSGLDQFGAKQRDQVLRSLQRPSLNERLEASQERIENDIIFGGAQDNYQSAQQTASVQARRQATARANQARTHQQQLESTLLQEEEVADGQQKRRLREEHTREDRQKIERALAPVIQSICLHLSSQQQIDPSVVNLAYLQPMVQQLMANEGVSRDEMQKMISALVFEKEQGDFSLRARQVSFVSSESAAAFDAALWDSAYQERKLFGGNLPTAASLGSQQNAAGLLTLGSQALDPLEQNRRAEAQRLATQFFVDSDLIYKLLCVRADSCEVYERALSSEDRRVKGLALVALAVGSSNASAVSLLKGMENELSKETGLTEYQYTGQGATGHNHDGTLLSKFAWERKQVESQICEADRDKIEHLNESMLIAARFLQERVSPAALLKAQQDPTQADRVVMALTDEVHSRIDSPGIPLSQVDLVRAVSMLALQGNHSADHDPSTQQEHGPVAIDPALTDLERQRLQIADPDLDISLLVLLDQHGLFAGEVLEQAVKLSIEQEGDIESDPQQLVGPMQNSIRSVSELAVLRLRELRTTLLDVAVNAPGMTELDNTELTRKAFAARQTVTEYVDRRLLMAFARDPELSPKDLLSDLDRSLSKDSPWPEELRDVRKFAATRLRVVASRIARIVDKPDGQSLVERAADHALFTAGRVERILEHCDELAQAVELASYDGVPTAFELFLEQGLQDQELSGELRRDLYQRGQEFYSRLAEFARKDQNDKLEHLALRKSVLLSFHGSEAQVLRGYYQLQRHLDDTPQDQHAKLVLYELHRELGKRELLERANIEHKHRLSAIQDVLDVDIDDVAAIQCNALVQRSELLAEKQEWSSALRDLDQAHVLSTDDTQDLTVVMSLAKLARHMSSFTAGKSNPRGNEAFERACEHAVLQPEHTRAACLHAVLQTAYPEQLAEACLALEEQVDRQELKDELRLELAQAFHLMGNSILARDLILRAQSDGKLDSKQSSTAEVLLIELNPRAVVAVLAGVGAEKESATHANEVISSVRDTSALRVALRTIAHSFGDKSALQQNETVSIFGRKIALEEMDSYALQCELAALVEMRQRSLALAQARTRAQAAISEVKKSGLLSTSSYLNSQFGGKIGLFSNEILMPDADGYFAVSFRDGEQGSIVFSEYKAGVSRDAIPRLHSEVERIEQLDPQLARLREQLEEKRPEGYRPGDQFWFEKYLVLDCKDLESLKPAQQEIASLASIWRSRMGLHLGLVRSADDIAQEITTLRYEVDNVESFEVYQRRLRVEDKYHSRLKQFNHESDQQYQDRLERIHRYDWENRQADLAYRYGQVVSEWFRAAEPTEIAINHDGLRAELERQQRGEKYELRAEKWTEVRHYLHNGLAFAEHFTDPFTGREWVSEGELSAWEKFKQARLEEFKAKPHFAVWQDFERQLLEVTKAWSDDKHIRKERDNLYSFRDEDGEAIVYFRYSTYRGVEWTVDPNSAEKLWRRLELDKLSTDRNEELNWCLETLDHCQKEHAKRPLLSSDWADYCRQYGWDAALWKLQQLEDGASYRSVQLPREQAGWMRATGAAESCSVGTVVEMGSYLIPTVAAVRIAELTRKGVFAGARTLLMNTAKDGAKRGFVSRVALGSAYALSHVPAWYAEVAAFDTTLQGLQYFLGQRDSVDLLREDNLLQAMLFMRALGAANVPVRAAQRALGSGSRVAAAMNTELGQYATQTLAFTGAQTAIDTTIRSIAAGKLAGPSADSVLDALHMSAVEVAKYRLASKVVPSIQIAKIERANARYEAMRLRQRLSKMTPGTARYKRTEVRYQEQVDIVQHYSKPQSSARGGAESVRERQPVEKRQSQNQQTLNQQGRPDFKPLRSDGVEQRHLARRAVSVAIDSAQVEAAGAAKGSPAAKHLANLKKLSDVVEREPLDVVGRELGKQLGQKVRDQFNEMGQRVANGERHVRYANHVRDLARRARARRNAGEQDARRERLLREMNRLADRVEASRHPVDANIANSWRQLAQRIQAEVGGASGAPRAQAREPVAQPSTPRPTRPTPRRAETPRAPQNQVNQFSSNSNPGTQAATSNTTPKPQRLPLWKRITTGVTLALSSFGGLPSINYVPRSQQRTPITSTEGAGGRMSLADLAPARTGGRSGATPRARTAAAPARTVAPRVNGGNQAKAARSAPTEAHSHTQAKLKMPEQPSANHARSQSGSTARPGPAHIFNSAEREVETRDPGAEYLAANLAVSETRGGDLLSGMDASSVSSNRSGTARMGRMIQSQARGEQAMLNVPSDAGARLAMKERELNAREAQRPGVKFAAKGEVRPNVQTNSPHTATLVQGAVEAEADLLVGMPQDARRGADKGGVPIMDRQSQDQAPEHETRLPIPEHSDIQTLRVSMPSAVARAENTQQQQQRQEGKNNNDSKHQRNKKANKTVWDYLDGGGRPEEKRPLQLAKLSRGWQDVKKWVIEECKYAYWKVLGDGEGEGFRRRYRQSVVVDPERGDTIESEYEGDWDESRVA